MDSDSLLKNPRNSRIVQYLRSQRAGSTLAMPASVSPDSIDNPYMSLGTHPELVSRLWDELTKQLPVPCRWVVYKTPALVRPDSATIFAFAMGSHVYGLRLALPQRAEMQAASVAQAEVRATKSALSGVAREKYLLAHAGDIHRFSNGSTFDIRTIGEEWIFGRWLAEEQRWCRSAYDAAA